MALRVEAVGLSLSSEAVGGRVRPGSKCVGIVSSVGFSFGESSRFGTSFRAEARSSARSLPVERLGIVSRVFGPQKSGARGRSRPPSNDQLRTGTIQGNPTV